MNGNKPLIYENPSVEVVLLQPSGSVLQSSTGALTQFVSEEDFQWGL